MTAPGLHSGALQIALQTATTADVLHAEAHKRHHVTVITPGADMKCVSTAFVGQVSAASSPAIAKLKGRARATNDPTYVPLASRHRAQSSRRRDPGRDLPRRTRPSGIR
jgi:hypothetical protein